MTCAELNAAITTAQTEVVTTNAAIIVDNAAITEATAALSAAMTSYNNAVSQLSVDNAVLTGLNNMISMYQMMLVSQGC